MQYARASLFGIAAQYTWSLLFVGMDALLSDSPAEGFDYWQEASSRWDWTRAKLEDPSLESLIAAAARLTAVGSHVDKVALVTGGSKGIGYACAERLLADGYAVAICARNADEVDRRGGPLAVPARCSACAPTSARCEDCAALVPPCWSISAGSTPW